MDKSFSVTFADDFAKFIASIKSFSVIDREKFYTSKFTNDDCFLLLMFSNQLMAPEMFFQWFKICLLILPISDFDGLISLNDEEFGNPSL